MGKLPVSQIKHGLQINEDVLTHSGNVLFQKNKILNQREIDILNAFQIKSVPTHTPGTEEQKNSETEVQKEQEKEKITPSFYKQYENMFMILKKTFENVRSVNHIPLLEIRSTLEGLTSHIKDYNPLNFHPVKEKAGDYLVHNSIKVSLTSYLLAVWCGFPTRDLMPIAIAGLLHDIGNMKIDEAILDKPSRLTKDELKDMRQHTQLGYSILKNVAGLNEGIKLTALQHHEKDDGSGYPLGVKSNKIHIYAKVVSIADIFHAMTTQRHHQERISPYLVLEQLLMEAFGKLDPSLVQVFIKKVTQFHNGTLVKLNDDSIGEIVFSDHTNPTRPWVKVKGKIINLTLNRSMFIKEVIEDK